MTAVIKPAAWFDNSWGARAKITISKDMAVGSTQSNYPFKLASLHNVIYGLSRSDGSDLLFVDNRNTKMLRDIASFDRLARTCEIYPQLPSLDGSVDTVFYIYFNNPDVSLPNDRVDHSITRMIRIAKSADDINIYNDGAAWQYSLDSNNFQAGYSGAAVLKMGDGARFLNALAPRYATANQCNLIITASAALAVNTVNTRICGELMDGGVFVDLANYQPRRGTDSGGADNTKRTVAEVAWDAISAFVIDTQYTSPSLVTVAQEMLNGSSQTNMVFFWDDHADRSTHAANCYRRGYTYTASSAKCPLLVLDFTPVATNYQTIELQYLGLEGNL